MTSLLAHQQRQSTEALIVVADINFIVSSLTWLCMMPVTWSLQQLLLV